MNHTDYLTACERLRRVESGELIHVVYPGANGPQDRVSDKLTVYDAEHDDTPATVEWLREVLGPLKQIRAEYLSWNIGKPGDGLRLWWLFDSQSIAINSVVDIPNPTRGEVLRLLGVFRERKV